MSQIENVITYTFRARGSQLIAQMGGIATGFGRVGTAVNATTRMSERMNAQWRAFATTIRYAIAGSVIFGLGRMAGQLKDIQVQLGLISAIGSQPGGGGPLGGLPFSTSEVNQLESQLRNTAVNVVKPVGELNDAVINLLSTVQDVKPSDVPAMITSIGQAATLSQTPIEDLTKAVTTMNIAFGRPNTVGNIASLTRQWYQLIRIAPGGISAAPEIVQQMGPLATMFTLGRGKNVSPAQGQSQMLGLALASLRFGGTPSTMLRGLTYMIQQIITPTTTKGAKALQSIGITPQFIQDKGIKAAIDKLLQHITYSGNVKNLANMSDAQIANLDQSGANIPGIPASQYQFLRTAMRRVTGVRAAIILAEQMKQRAGVSSYQQDINLMEKAQANQVAGVNTMAQAWKRFEKRAQLQKAVVSINSMALQVAQIFEPVLNFAAGKIAGLQNVMGKHPGTTQKVVLGTAAFMAALGVGKFVGLPSLGSLLGKGGSGFVKAEAVSAAMAHTGGLGGSPLNPLYVIVVGEIFNPNAGQPQEPKSIVGPKSNSFWSQVAGKLKSAGQWAAGPAGYVATKAPWLARALPDVAALTAIAATAGWQQKNIFDPIDRFLGITPTLTNLQKAQAIYGTGVSGVENVHKVAGKADVYLTLDMKDASGKITRKKVHVPVDLWSGGRAPSSRGKAATTRGN